jgi:hypothetical protein
LLPGTSPTKDRGRNKQHVELYKLLFINIKVIFTHYNYFKMLFHKGRSVY